MQNEKKVAELNMNDILPNRFQPRIKFNPESINELAISIKKYGVIQPIVVRKIGEKYEIIAGERRYKASAIAGKETIPAIVSEMTDNESVEIALIENVQREDLTPIEKAISYKKILDMGYMNQEELAKKIGKSQSSIANSIRLLGLYDDAQEALLDGKISERHARSLLTVKDEKQQNDMLKRIITERLTVRKTDEEIEKMMNLKNNEELNNLDEVVKIPDNVIDPGFMDIGKIENQAEDIYKPEREVNNIDALLKPDANLSISDDESDDEILIPGRFFNFFNENEGEFNSSQDDQKTKSMGKNDLSINSEVPQNEFFPEIPSYEESTQPGEQSNETNNFPGNNIFPTNELFSETPNYETPAQPVEQPNITNDLSVSNEGSQDESFPEIPSNEIPTQPVEQLNETNYFPGNNIFPTNELFSETPSNETPTQPVEQPNIANDFSINSEGSQNEFFPEILSNEIPTQPIEQLNEVNDFPGNSEIPQNENVYVEKQENFSNPVSIDNLAQQISGFSQLNLQNQNSLDSDIEAETIPKYTIPVEPIYEEDNDNNYNPQEAQEISNNEAVLNQPIVEPYVEKSLKIAINTIRECASNLEKMDFVVDLEEIDFEDTYQVIFKITK